MLDPKKIQRRQRRQAIVTVAKAIDYAGPVGQGRKHCNTMADRLVTRNMNGAANMTASDGQAANIGGVTM